MTVFSMDKHSAYLFFRVCKRYGIEQEDKRVVLLREFEKRGLIKIAP
jgi:hypothetical protein